MKHKVTSFFERLLGANTLFRSSAFVFASAVCIHNFPWLISWLPVEIQGDVQTGAYHVMREGALLLFAFGKQGNVSGLGTAVAPHMKPDDAGFKRTVR